MSDLVALVDSTADDLGIDLDMRPSKKDDEKFDKAPVEGSITPFFTAWNGF